MSAGENAAILTEVWRPAGRISRAALRLYDSIMHVVVALVLVPRERWRRLRGRATAAEKAERAGVAELPLRRPGSSRFVIHASAVGEMRAAVALAQALAAADPACEVILTAGTREARADAERFRSAGGAVFAVQLLPWDRAAAVRRWLRALRPDAVAVVETEIWPALFVGCRTLAIPLVVVSGRVARRDVRRYRLLRSFFSTVLGCADWIGVQDEDQRQRFLSIGADEPRLHVVGNLKVGSAPVPMAEPVSPGPPVLVAGSTHRPEERWLLEALRQLLASSQRARLVLAPRNPARAATLCRLARRLRLRVRRWSDGLEGEWDVLVLDRIGPLAGLYCGAALALVGGTLSRHGGHSPLEAAAAGVPLLVGPHCANLGELAALLDRVGALLRLGSAADLEPAWARLLADASRRREMGAAAASVVRGGSSVVEVYARTLLASSAGGVAKVVARSRRV